MQERNVSAGAVEVSKLRAIRKAAGLTQVQLSQRANVSRFRLCMAESDSLELRPDEIEAINQALEPEMERAAHIASDFQSASVAQGRRDLARKPIVRLRQDS
jgi:DNA-binding XRE family transcriptional regulator